MQKINDKSLCVIAGASDIYKERMPDLSHAYIIACDGGFGSLQKLGVLPDAVIGDFDSLGYIPSCDNITVLPTSKDDTDTFYAVKSAMDKGYRDFYFIGCTGGKRDEHTYANISVMLYIVRRGGRAIMEGERQMYQVISGPATAVFFGERGYFSAFSLSEKSVGVCMRGFEYEMECGVLSYDVPLGVSNSFKNEKCEITLEKGELLLIWEK